MIHKNDDKSYLNLCKLSRWLMIYIIEFLNDKDTIVLGSVSRSLKEASQDEYVWWWKILSIHGD